MLTPRTSEFCTMLNTPASSTFRSRQFLSLSKSPQWRRFYGSLAARPTFSLVLEFANSGLGSAAQRHVLRGVYAGAIFSRPWRNTRAIQINSSRNFAVMSKINIVEDSNEAELAHHRQQRLDHARAAENASRHATNPHGFVNVFFEVHVEGMLQQPGIPMIVLRHDQN